VECRVVYKVEAKQDWKSYVATNTKYVVPNLNQISIMTQDVLKIFQQVLSKEQEYTADR